MAVRARIAKHPIHPMLVVFPIGLWVFSWISDLVWLTGLGTLRWWDIAFVTMAAGLIGALLAAVPGLIDLRSISDPRAGKIAWNHMVLNLIAVGIFAFSLYWRSGSPAGAVFPVALSTLGILVVVFSGWLGGELVYVHGVGVGERSGAADLKPQRPGRVRRLRG